MFPLLSSRQRRLLGAALSYARANADDLGEALGEEFAADEFETLSAWLTGAPMAPREGLRAFVGAFLVAVDASERTDDDEEDGDGADGVLEPTTLSEVVDYLADALRVDLDTEEQGNPIGVSSVELILETLTELPAEQVDQLYRR